MVRQLTPIAHPSDGISCVAAHAPLENVAHPGAMEELAADLSPTSQRVAHLVLGCDRAGDHGSEALIVMAVNSDE